MKTKTSALFSYQELAEKEKRNLLIADLVRKKGVVSRTEISRITGINAVSVSNYVNNYIRKRIVLEKGFDVSSGGRKPELIEFNAKGSYVMGLEIGRERIKGALTNLAMNIMAKVEMPTEVGEPLHTPGVCNGSREAMADQIVRCVENILKKSKMTKDEIKTIGIGVPDNGYIHVGRDVQKRIGIETFVGGYAFCSAFGEKTLNPEADISENLLYIYSDTGRGIFIKQDSFFGAAGAFGEIQDPDMKSSKGQKGFDEELKYLNPWPEGFSIIRSAKQKVAKGVGTKIVDIAKADIANIRGETVIEAAKQGDRVALDILEVAGINLGLRMAYLINLFDPQVVVIGGGIEKAGGLILDHIKKMINRYAFVKRSGSTKIISSILGEDAVSLGASSLAAREIFLKA